MLKQLIEIFTDPGDVVIDPCAGSGNNIKGSNWNLVDLVLVLRLRKIFVKEQKKKC